ncbi:MAG: FAD:protein FMN transferase [Acidobacteriota bacterium]
MTYRRIVWVAFGLLAAACRPTETGPVIEQFSGPTMGTNYTVKIVADRAGQTDLPRLQAAVDQILADVNHRMSHYEDDSEISRFNAWHSSEPFSASREMIDILALARDIESATNGAFDITVAPLVNAWGFGPPGKAPTAPDPEQIEKLLNRTGWEGIQIDESGSTIAKVDPELTIDLSAIAKGHGVDRVVATLEAAGLANFMVEVGGEVATRGLNRDGQPWRIGIERPIPGKRAVELVVPLSDLSMATSGDYRNYYEIEGKRISHTIDPRTGYPITHSVASVSVVHPRCAEADAYATGLLVLGADGFELAEEIGLAAYFLFRDSGEVFMGRMTAQFKDLLEQSDHEPLLSE